MRLRIVIPVYNVEQYLERCLHSCLSQGIQEDDYEIVLVDDGSTDGSAIIADEYCDRYANIRGIHQVNKGLSEARNAGLQLAKGSYIWFVDSDDWIKENCLSQLLKQCEDNDLDILSFCAADIVNNDSQRRFSYSFSDQLLKGSEVLSYAHYPPCAPFYIYKREFLIMNELKFYPGIFHEDSEFQPRAYYYANRVMMSNEIYYYVYHNPTSIGRTFNTKKAYDQIIVMQNLSAFIQTNDLKSANGFHYRIGRVMNNALEEAAIFNKVEQKRFNEALYDNKKLFAHLWQSGIPKYRIEFVLFSLFRKRYTSIYSLLRKAK